MKDTLNRENRRLEDRACPACGETFRPLRAASRYCSTPCARSKNGGQNKKPETWWTDSKGYIQGRIWLPDGTQIRVKKHRFIMEGILGRPLLASEDVHHKDGNKSNNEPSNLEVIDHGSHSTLSNTTRIYKRGYKMNLSPAERKARSLRAISIQLDEIGRAALAKASGRERGES